MDIDPNQKKLLKHSKKIIIVLFLGGVVSSFVPYFFIVHILVMIYLIYIWIKIFKLQTKLKYFPDKKLIQVTEKGKTLLFPFSKIYSIEHFGEDDNFVLNIAVVYRELTPFGQSSYFMFSRSKKATFKNALLFIEDFNKHKELVEEEEFIM